MPARVQPHMMHIGCAHDRTGLTGVRAALQVEQDMARVFGADPALVQQVPFLTPELAEQLCDKRLVRFRGMVSGRAWGCG